MHWQLLVSFDRTRAASSTQARRFAYETLAHDPFFWAEGAIGAVCDWFVVGGRSSGALAEAKADAALAGDDRVVPRARVSSSLPRDPYRALGHEDDAMVVDEALYRTFLRSFAGKPEGYLDTDLVYKDLDGEPIGPGFVGRKWLVVIDCHS